MSHVDNVILSWDLAEDYAQRLEDINQWMFDHADGQQLEDIARHVEVYGGHKALETVLLVGAINFMPETDFLEFVGSLPWTHPEAVQYIVNRQLDDKFHVVRPLLAPTTSKDEPLDRTPATN
jgi:hypothetical protein